jgi:hypothetical protein
MENGSLPGTFQLKPCLNIKQELVDMELNCDLFGK